MYDLSEQIPTKRQRCDVNEQQHNIETDATPSGATNVVGNVSADLCLPTVSGYHRDLNYITPQTLESLLNKSQQLDNNNLIIVDCRYPYEFNGGHIQGAVNLYTKEAIQKQLIESPSHRNERTVIVFHCEFSSERGPKMCRFLRGQDRAAHSECYPQLYYPEIYVLQGGYKAFYEQYGSLQHCHPQTYRPMLHQQYHKQLQHYRKKTKMWGRHHSWHGRDLISDVTSRNINFYEL